MRHPTKGGRGSRREANDVNEGGPRTGGTTAKHVRKQNAIRKSSRTSSCASGAVNTGHGHGGNERRQRVRVCKPQEWN